MYVCQKKSLKIPVREAPPLHVPPTGFLWKEMLRLQSKWFTIHLYLSESPKRSPPMKCGENIRSPSTEPHADGRPTYNGVRPGSPRGSLTTLLSLYQCHATFSTIPSTLVWVDQSPLASVWRIKPQEGIPSTPVTVSHVTQGGVEYEST